MKVVCTRSVTVDKPANDRYQGTIRPYVTVYMTDITKIKLNKFTIY